MFGSCFLFFCKINLNGEEDQVLFGFVSFSPLVDLIKLRPQQKREGQIDIIRLNLFFFYSSECTAHSGNARENALQTNKHLISKTSEKTVICNCIKQIKQ